MVKVYWAGAGRNYSRLTGSHVQKRPREESRKRTKQSQRRSRDICETRGACCAVGPRPDCPAGPGPVRTPQGTAPWARRHAPREALHLTGPDQLCPDVGPAPAFRFDPSSSRQMAGPKVTSAIAFQNVGPEDDRRCFYSRRRVAGGCASGCPDGRTLATRRVTDRRRCHVGADEVACEILLLRARCFTRR